MVEPGAPVQTRATLCPIGAAVAES